ncbi:MAG: hypothetical protein MJY63_01335 [Paludibacteraceae bacterium]|nr:hypothetical protein [Paludibacteraceae bacterium]
MANLLWAYVPKQTTAETECEIYLVFDKTPTENDKSSMLYIHLYDSIFMIDYSFPCVKIENLKDGTNRVRIIPKEASTQYYNGNSPDYHVKTLTVKFPKHLAGGSFTLDFYLLSTCNNIIPAKKAIEHTSKSLNDFLNDVQRKMIIANNGSFSMEIDILPKDKPSIEDVFWGEYDYIEYGSKGDKRFKDDVKESEPLHLHIHTEGLYGHKVVINDFKGNKTETIVKDNVLVKDFIYTGASMSSLLFGKIGANVSYTIPSGFWYKSDYVTEKKVSNPLKLAPENSKSQFSYGSSLAVNVMTGNLKTETKITQAKCYVEFRPEASYKGDFGFSWFRLGDTGYKWDKSFLDTMGYLYEKNNTDKIIQDINKSDGVFKKNTNLINNHIRDFNKIVFSEYPEVNTKKDKRGKVWNVPYMVPVMSIKKGTEAKLTMLVKEKEKPKKWLFEFSNKSVTEEGYLSINVTETTSLSNKSSITIKCNKEFSKKIRLNVFSVGQDDTTTLCGGIDILANDIMHQSTINILVVDISRKNNQRNQPIWGSAVLQNAMKGLNSLYSQAYINFKEVKRCSINLTNPQLNSFSNIYDSFYFDSSKTKLDSYSVYRKFLKFLKSLVPNEYDDRRWIKIFLIPDSDTRVNGFSYGQDKIVVLYKGCTFATPTHEIGHALGLPHTFTGCTSSAKYTYDFATTDNIMDYSHLKDIDRHSFFHWQWQSMNRLL